MLFYAYFLYKESVSQRNSVTRFVDQVTKCLVGEFIYIMKILAYTNLPRKYDILDLMSKIINLCNHSNYGSEP